MMYPRLKLAKDLLTDDGVIFISIDDNEVENLKKICNEVFGEQNYEGHIHWRRRHNQPNDKTKMIGLVAEHILSFAKNSSVLRAKGVGKIDITGNFSNPDSDPRGDWASKPWKAGSDQSGSRYSITTPNGVVLNEEWMGDESTYNTLLEDGRIIFPRGGDGMPRKKYFKFEREEEGQCATNWWTHENFGHNQGANDCITELFGSKNIFSNPKPIELIRGLIQIGNVKENDIVLDFFSGSATTAHSLIKLNLEDDFKRRKFILVQLPEDLDETKERADSKTKKSIQCAIEFLDSINKSHLITEIGKERIRRAGQKIKAENPETAKDLDIGFRVMKLDSTNMKDVFYTPEDTNVSMFSDLTDNIKADRTPEDLLFQVMLDLGVLLSSKIETITIEGKHVFSVADGFLMACFDEKLTDATITAIAKMKPYYFVMRDHSLATDAVAANFDQIFAAYSPDTVRKVL